MAHMTSMQLVMPRPGRLLKAVQRTSAVATGVLRAPWVGAGILPRLKFAIQEGRLDIKLVHGEIVLRCDC